MIVSSRTKLAKLLGVSLTMVNIYSSEGMPGSNEEGYDVEECRQWLEARRQASGRPTKAEPTGDELDLREQKLRAEIRKLNAEAEAKELKNQIANGSVYLADEADQFMSQAAVRARERIEQWPAEAIVGIPPEFRDAIREQLERSARELLLELAAMKFTPEGHDADLDS